ncbi:hypothetical protein HYV70_02865, partial [Candidatus Uhrbacteria bacterium]|nr:hypothetical protein [Candidatus Uhrbacteria bacterium]
TTIAGSATSSITLGTAFTVAATTGLTTIAGAADGTDALVLTLGDILVSDGDLDLVGGDFNVALDAGDGASVSKAAATSATASLAVANTTAASDTSGSEGLDVALTVANYADDGAADTHTGLDVLVTSNTSDAGTDDIIYGIQVQNLGGAADGGNEYAIYQAGTTWDLGLKVEDAVDIDGAANIADTTAGADVTMGNSTGNLTFLSDNADFTLTDATDNVFQLVSSAAATLLDIDLGAADAITLGDNSTTIALNSSDWDISTGGLDVDDAFVVADGGVLTTSQTANFDGTVDFDSLIDATAGVVQGASPLVFEGLTANDFESTFAFTDPTADNTITFQNGSGTVAFLTDVVGGSSLFTDGGTVSYLTSTTDDLAIGATTLTAPFSVDVDTNILRVGDGTSDTNDPTITFYASDATDSGSLSYLDTDGWFFSGGNMLVGASAETIGDTNFTLTGDDAFVADDVGIEGTLYVDGGTIVDGRFESPEDILASPTTEQVVSYINHLFGNAITGDREDIASFTRARSNQDAASNTYYLIGDAAVAGFEGDANNAGTINVYGRYTEAIVNYNDADQADQLTGEYISMGESGFQAGNVTGSINLINGQYRNNFLTSANLRGVNIDMVHENNGYNHTNVNGFRFTFDNQGTSVITNMYGLQVSAANSGAGSFTNSYGVYVGSTGGTSEWSYYAIDGAGTAAFLDDVVVGAATETISDSGSLATFSNNGDDLFVNGQMGAEGVIFSDSGMEVQANTTSRIGAFFNDGNLDTHQGVFIQGCLDASPTAACNLLELRDGDGTVIGAIEGNGAGGVTNASSGSDYAELFPGTLANFSEGNVLALDEAGNVTLATQTNTPIGAYSVSPNVLGNWVEGWETAGNAVPVALLGQVPVRVNDEGGSIAIGDYLTLSSVPGVAKKATGVGFMLGRALATHANGNGTILVFIEPTWQALDLVTDSNGATELRDDIRVVSPEEATEENALVNSPSISLRGSVWNESTAHELEMKMKTVVEDQETYRLSISNTSESEVAYVTNEGLMRIAGDMIIGGNIYPSDRGVPQTEKYIYYDGSEGSGGDFMRTNAKGWSTGSYDFAEMFFANEVLKAGEVVAFDGNGVDGQVHRSTGGEHEQLAGIVSTRPGFLAGENNEHNYPIALAGRVPTRVNLQGGVIQVGDPLAASTEIGVATKATKPGSIIGYALESYDGTGDGLIVTFVNVGYWGGEPTTAMPGTQNTASQTSTQRTEFTSLNLTGDISMNGYRVLNVGRLTGLVDTWSIESDGTIQTQGLIKNAIVSHQGEMVETIAVVSPEAVITLSGTAQLTQGEVEVRFEDVVPEYNDIISATAPLRVVVTPNGPVSLYVSEKDQNHFVVKRFAGEEDSSFDWIVTAYRRGYEPVEEVRPEDTTEVQTTSQAEPTQEHSSDDQTLESEQAAEEETTEETDTQEVLQEEEQAILQTEISPVPEPVVQAEPVVPVEIPVEVSSDVSTSL